MFLTSIFCRCERRHAKVETKDEEVVACGAMKVCVFYYCLICVSIPIWPFSNCCEVQAKEDEVATWRCKEGSKMTVCRAIGVCIFYYYLFFYQWSPFHAVVRCKPKKTKLWHAERRCAFSVVKYIISFFVIVEVQAKTKKWRHVEQWKYVFSIITIQFAPLHWSNNNIQFAYSSS